MSGQVLPLGAGGMWFAPVGTPMPVAAPPVEAGWPADASELHPAGEPCAMAPYADTQGLGPWPDEMSVEFTAPYPSALWQLLLGLTARERARKMRARFRHVRHRPGRDARGWC